MLDLTIGVQYLTGRVVATDPSDRTKAEWPPHPARIYMAMAAAHFETGADPREGEALRWLEGLPAPELRASRADHRTTVTAFVPVNDKAEGKGLLSSGLPRGKQMRSFPAVHPHDDTVFFIWPDADANGHTGPLQQLCAKVTRVGHSSSMVQVWVCDRPPESSNHIRWLPDEGLAERHYRIATRGILSRLMSDYERGQRPKIGTWLGYRQVSSEQGEPVRDTIWSQDLLIRRLKPIEGEYRRLDLVATLQVCRGLQQALVSHAPEPVPEHISGHRADGQPSEQPHLGCFPLAFVGSQYATGQLLGVAVALPKGLSRSHRMEALASLGGVEKKGLRLGRLGRWSLVPDDTVVNLQRETWTAGKRGSRHWATVTPVVFDRHAKSRDPEERNEECADMIRLACERIGLPRPREVVMTPVSPHLGVPAAHEFPRLSRKDGTDRRHSHAILLFDDAVHGPIAVGAGRYRGYGLCRPYDASGGAL
jgi:CRISPR-associated protein Csb2